MAMYSIFSVVEQPTETGKLLAVMPMTTMYHLFALHKDAVKRVEQETEDNGICKFYFRKPIPGFGQKVIIQRMVENH